MNHAMRPIAVNKKSKGASGDVHPLEIEGEASGDVHPSEIEGEASGDVHSLEIEGEAMVMYSMVNFKPYGHGDNNVPVAGRSAWQFTN
jgi:hypothetical protein